MGSAAGNNFPLLAPQLLDLRQAVDVQLKRAVCFLFATVQAQRRWWWL
jgi:hypothetical protein